jgi:eukaryotic-like serine/threonine-protein kinase
VPRRDYTVTRQIGVGGAGVVDEVFSIYTDEYLAMKRLSRDSLLHDESVRRFQREVKILMSLSHPNIFPIIDADLDCDEPWFVMPLADSNMKDIIPSGGLSEDVALSILNDVINGLAYAHNEGVVHRDIKPQNVLIINEIPILSDFGLGRILDSETLTLTVTGAGRGTEGYVAPEQWTDFHTARGCYALRRDHTIAFKV